MRKKLPLISGILNVLEKLKGNTGIIENTSVATHTIAAGKYVIWKNDLYKASSAISIGDTLSLSNLTAVSDGIANELNSNFNAVLTTYPLKVIKATDYQSTEFGTNSLCVVVPGTIPIITASFNIDYDYLEAKYTIYVNGIKTYEWNKGSNVPGGRDMTWTQQINIPPTGASIFIGIKPIGDGGGSQTGSVTFS